ncbi:MAG TPA: enoyl-CoA hydratase-related protein [Thermohalobaculum sp.]|nr:enoyl-CoA hydratase-related protein [Thermohalobaculum sp.]
MQYENLLYAVVDDVATITLNRPDRMNSLNAAMRSELLDALSRAPRDARAVVLTGAGRGFCAGQDLGDTGNIAELNLERVLREEYEPLLKLVYDCPAPVICAVNGAAAGAGANLALAADVVIAARSAVFLEAFARIGLIPDAGGTYWLPRLGGMARAMGMCLFADPIPAERAAQWGLIWEVVDDDQIVARATELAGRLAKGPTVAYRLMKQALRASMSNDLETQLALEARLQGEAGQTRDFMEGIAAFMEKRPASYEGR